MPCASVVAYGWDEGGRCGQNPANAGLPRLFITVSVKSSRPTQNAPTSMSGTIASLVALVLSTPPDRVDA
jgi:hypothetical protein